MRMTRDEQLSTGWVDESHQGGMLLAVLGHLGEADRDFLAGLANAGDSAHAVVLDVSTWDHSGPGANPLPPLPCAAAGGRRPPSNATAPWPPPGWGWRNDLLGCPTRHRGTRLASRPAVLGCLARDGWR